jgi:glycopeptide antibiotics resistance protein
MLNNVLLILTSCIVYIGFLIKNITKKKSAKEQFVFTVFYVYIIALLSVTFFPFPYQPRLLHDLRLGGQPKNNIIPFNDIYFMIMHDSTSDLIKQIAGNILLFMPFGFLIPLIKMNLTFRKALIIGIIGSASVEIIQLILDILINYNYRISDIDDVILNLLGFVIGYSIFKMSNPILELPTYFNKSNKIKSS